MSAAALGNAASFLKASDPRRAEAFLIRAHRLEPDEPSWTSALAFLYADVLYPSSAGTKGSPVIAAEAAFVAAVRERVDTTRDARLLSAMGRALMSRDATAANDYLRRARTLDRGDIDATRTLAGVDQIEWMRRLSALLAKPDSREAVVSGLPTDERLRALVYLANGDYLQAENADWMASHPPNADQRQPENVAKRQATARDLRAPRGERRAGPRPAPARGERSSQRDPAARLFPWEVDLRPHAMTPRRCLSIKHRSAVHTSCRPPWCPRVARSAFVSFFGAKRPSWSSCFTAAERSFPCPSP